MRKDGRRGIPRDMPELAEIVVPLLLAGEVVAIKARGAEADDDPLTVGDGRGGAVGAGGVLRLLVVILDNLFPEALAIGPVKAPQGPRFPLGVERLREEDALTPHDRGGVPLLRQVNLPFDVFGIAPGGGQVLFRRLAVAVRSAPARP